MEKLELIHEKLYEAHVLMMQLLEEKKELKYLKLATKIRELDQKITKDLFNKGEGK